MVPKEEYGTHKRIQLPNMGNAGEGGCKLVGRVPAIVKPATVTSFLTEAMVKDIIASGILPKGCLAVDLRSAGDLDHVDCQDVVTFTGSASTGRMLKAKESIINNSVPFNMEADSLNSSILGPDAVQELRIRPVCEGSNQGDNCKSADEVYSHQENHGSEKSG